MRSITKSLVPIIILVIAMAEPKAATKSHPHKVLENVGLPTSEKYTAAPAKAQTVMYRQGSSDSSGWCATQSMYDAKIRATEGGALSGQFCPRPGPCDDSTMRDSFKPDTATEIKIVRLYFHVMRDDDGSNPAASEDGVAQQVAWLNQNFAPYRFEFEYQMRFVNSSAYRNITSDAEYDQMKNVYAIAPDSQLNIFVAWSNVGGFWSFGTFPWESDALSNTGGIFMNSQHFDPSLWTLFTHEMGHTLGLMHTFRGVENFPPCVSCYEEAQTSNGDITGDLCQDTPPTPLNRNCGDPGGTDPCNGLPWGSTDFPNYMSYAPSSCQTHFTDQQTGRIHCWSEDVLLGWMVIPDIEADDVLGPPPHTVNFTGSSSISVTQWNWDFGDTATSNLRNPTHVYNNPGLFTISLNVQTTNGGDYQTINSDFVYSVAETLTVADVQGGASQSVRVDISINNHVPLTKITLPVSYDGPLGLGFDSVSTVGLRTSNLTIDNGGISETNNDFSNRRLIRQLLPGAAQPIQPGSGPILSFYFHTPPFEIPGINPIRLISYGLMNPRLHVLPGDFLADVVGGSVEMSCCVGNTGNADGDPGNVVDIADLTFLIDHLFINFPPLACPLEGNVDGDPAGDVDIADLTFLIDHLFINFPPTAACL